LDEVTKFGPLFLTEQEFKARLNEVTRAYYRFLGHNVVPPRNREFWDFHLRHVKAMGYQLSYARIALHAILRILDQIGNPKRTIESVIERFSQTWARPSQAAVAAPPIGDARE
jgi:hypothetical protein